MCACARAHANFALLYVALHNTSGNQLQRRDGTLPQQEMVTSQRMLQPFGTGSSTIAGVCLCVGAGVRACVCVHACGCACTHAGVCVCVSVCTCVCARVPAAVCILHAYFTVF